MTLTDTSDLPLLVQALRPRRYTDANGHTWEVYRDPLAPEVANPYRWVDGYKVQTGRGVSSDSDVDSPRK